MGNEAAKTYSLADSTLVFGVPLEGAFGKNEMISIKPTMAAVEVAESVDGSVAFVIKNSSCYEVTLTFTQTSSNNAIMMAAYIAQQKSKVALPLVWKEGANGFVSPTAMIKQIPDVKRSGSIEDQAWVIIAADGVAALAGG